MDQLLAKYDVVALDKHFLRMVEFQVDPRKDGREQPELRASWVEMDGDHPALTYLFYWVTLGRTHGWRFELPVPGPLNERLVYAEISASCCVEPTDTCSRDPLGMEWPYRPAHVPRSRRAAGDCAFVAFAVAEDAEGAAPRLAPLGEYGGTAEEASRLATSDYPDAARVLLFLREGPTGADPDANGVVELEPPAKPETTEDDGNYRYRTGYSPIGDFRADTER